MRITSQMLAANQLKAGIEPSSKTLLDYIQNDDNDSLTSLLSKKTDTSTSSLTRILKMMLILLQRMQLNSQMRNLLFLLMQKRPVIILQYMRISNL